MKNNHSITFILSGPAMAAVGGLRIIYEYANRLSRKGWMVTVVHPVRLEKSDGKLNSFLKLKRNLGLIKNKVLGSYLPKKWFLIDSKVKMLLIPNLNEKYIPDADYIVAGPSQCAAFVNDYGLRKGKKCYFIQGFEDWVMPVHDLENTWRMPMKKIVISKWLQNKLEQINEPSIYIPNGLDFTSFSSDVPFHKRDPFSILFISHTIDLKGTIYAVNAVKTIKESYPGLTVTAFSIYKKPAYFPTFIRYHQNPSQQQIRALYNSASIFIAPSLSEGWGLTVCEAMMCGCAVVATDIPGHREFLVNNENGVFCSPGSADSIAEKIEWLFNNPKTANAIALRAPESLKKFDWDSRVALFEQALLS
jgi:glycosyltransferase involved in cell wall biosynthesis